MNDNRNYTYSKNSISKRSEFDQIIKWVKKGSSVIDLGCGDGTLLSLLKDKKNIKRAEGIEIVSSGVVSAKKKGLNVWRGRIDIPLNKIKDKSYDYAICNVTLQMVMYPEILLSEMRRISRYQIISFPNFAFFFNRLDLLINGRMPRPMIFGYKWYSTGHIHHLSIKDFEEYCRDNKIRVEDKYFMVPKNRFIFHKILKLFPNLCASAGVYLLSTDL